MSEQRFDLTDTFKGELANTDLVSGRLAIALKNSIGSQSVITKIGRDDGGLQSALYGPKAIAIAEQDLIIDRAIGYVLYALYSMDGLLKGNFTPMEGTTKFTSNTDATELSQAMADSSRIILEALDKKYPITNEKARALQQADDKRDIHEFFTRLVANVREGGPHRRGLLRRERDLLKPAP